MAAIWAGDLGSPGGVREAAEAALAAPPAPDPPRAADVLLDAFALRFTHGYAAAAPALTRALELLLALDSSPSEARRWLWLVGARSASTLIAVELWDFDSWQALTAGQVQAARDAGAFVRLQFALTYLARAHLLAGELAAAAELLDEDQLIADATGNPPVAIDAMMLAAWRGRELEAAEVIEATVEKATARGFGMLVDFADHASAVLYNGLGRHDAARDAARRAFERDQLGSRPASGPCSARASPPSGCTVSPSTASAAPASVPNWPAVTCSTGSGCAGRTAAWTRGSSCAPPTACWTRWAWRRSPSGPAASWWPPARPSASASGRPSARVPTRPVVMR